MKITMVVDIICSHSYLAFHHLRQALDAHRADGGDAEVSFLPYRLDPGAPPEPEPVTAVLERRFGPAALDAAAGMAEKAAAEGLVLDYGRALNANTRSAHLHLVHAERHGRAEEMAEHLFRAHFTEGLDIGDPATLADLSAETGVPGAPGAEDREELARREERTRALGVRGVPVVLTEAAGPLVGDRSRADFARLLAGGR
ncbi:DsbA family protein [Nocardiopsis sp. RSe5-2]|uniref:DsbA family protein n=1 Tax=Nocardiopsis endophytica TaxID=3018445 RepID=A0ABT4U8S4_9ACTN|nr:DsbA family protein [Nocardiopsis endophytica]MDA2813355.1 DsbA family protein [Nocardiopsis endophytica]